MALTPTDLPEPVVPAISRWGILREVGDVGLAADGLAQRHGQRLARALVLGRGQQVAQVDGLARRVGQLDADGVAAGHDGDAAGGALIERAMSSARPRRGRDFTPAAGTSS